MLTLKSSTNVFWSSFLLFWHRIDIKMLRGVGIKQSVGVTQSQPDTI